MIRQMKETDIPECVDLIRESLMTVADQFGFTKENAPRFTAFATTPERLAYHLTAEKRPMYVYADPDHTIAGYYSLALPEAGTCELNNLCVLPDYRHQGTGSRLLFRLLPLYMRIYGESVIAEHAGHLKVREVPGVWL